MKKQLVKQVSKLSDMVLIKDGAFYVALCRSLKISTYGKTKKEAMFAFDEVLKIFNS